ncbi:BA14K family protein [Sinorhizobium sp. BG8]|uniref:BA14K family protein n=1 Tax=Sinorhizobium sp. BG8 TaxID=2613773 RepID=UPI001FED79B9|nr:BA14K family protein [Sinorhizobium sp. BG8]
MAVSSVLPAEAAPPISKSVPGYSDVEQVQYRHRPRPKPRRGWHNGHRGYHHARPGYRRWNDGYWYPLAAFGAGALIGGAIASSPRVTTGSAHVNWCANRYRSYRAYDNTFQPYNGPRQQCYSPYMR